MEAAWHEACTQVEVLEAEKAELIKQQEALEAQVYPTPTYSYFS